MNFRIDEKAKEFLKKSGKDNNIDFMYAADTLFDYNNDRTAVNRKPKRAGK